MARTRTAAAELIDQGYVRVNGKRVEQVAKPVSAGDILTIALANRVMVLEVLGFSERRGPYSEASQLYRLIEGGAPAPESGPQESGPKK